ncbi:MAG: DegT/DnrJ/EryC1/StrS family aminotransferase [Deltaproteobacteria bacterium]|nr:DegT/DnrJ/EryC1/StrS family aminotransferase [Deltaproteobacteria bacterium]
MIEKIAILGGTPMVKDPPPHFQWPPPVPDLAETIGRYIASGNPLSIVDRSGIYQQLEDRMCELHNRRYAILTSSGTMALYSAFFGLDLKPGDEVISTVYSFHATATPLLHFGVKIIFCDVEPDTGNINTEEIEALITPRTRAVVSNNMWGHPVDVNSIYEICRRNNLAWVEDCSHAHFAEYEGKYVGTSGDVAVFSLQGNKLLTGGEGGILLTDSTEIYERATLLGHSLKRSINCVKQPRWQEIRRTGFGLKLRMHPLAAVMVLHLLDNYCFEWIASREETLSRFADGLAATGQIMPPARRDYVTSMGARYGFKPKIDSNALGVPREKLVAALKAEGLDVSIPGSPPFHRLPIFDHRRFRIGSFEKTDNSNRQFPGAEAYYADILSLPTFTFPADWPMVDRYIEAFNKVFNNLEDLK